MPPILFVHGNGDHAALWITTLWRMESNGVPRERMFAINFTDPLARTDDKVEQPGRSSTEDQRRELADAIKELKRSTGASRVALVGNSRGGYPIRNLVKNGGGADVSHAVLCGVPNHGVYVWDEGLGSEFNGRGPFLRGLNAGESEVTGHRVPDAAQRRQRQVCASRRPLRRQARHADRRHIDGPALKGATNLVLGAIDHREIAFRHAPSARSTNSSPAANPQRIAIVPEPNVKLSGLVTGTPGGVRPTARCRAHRSMSIASRLIPASARAVRSIARRPAPTAAGVRRRSIRPGISKSC